VVPVQLLARVSFSQPADSVVVVAGGSVALSREAQGGGTIQYQWERQRSGRWSAVTGATSNVLALATVRLSDEGAYRLSATNARSVEPVLSATINLTVREVDVITSQPVSVSVNPGDAAVFEVKAKGVDLVYQWRKNGVDVPGATASVFTVISLGGSASADKAEREGTYDVLVKHAFGSSVSAAARLQVNVPVNIELQPVNTSVVAGNSAKLFVVASGTPDLTYQWRKGGVTLAGATASSYEIVSGSASASAVAGQYDVVVGNVVGQVTSSPAVVSVLTPVSITTSPADVVNAAPGAAVSFTVGASGTSLQYQWRKNGVPLEEGVNGVSGTRSATLSIGSVDPGSDTDLGSAGRYDVVVSNTVNSVASLPATLSVNAPPVILVQPKNVVVNRGDGARFSVGVRGAGLSYQWLVNGTVAASETRSELIIGSVLESQFGNTYRVVITNTSGSVTSSTVTLTKFAGIQFSAQPLATGAAEIGQTVTVGNPATGIVGGAPVTLLAPAIAQNGFTLAYQWRKDGVNILGATESAYVVLVTSKSAAGVYDVVVSAIVDGAEKARIVSPATLLELTGPPEIAPLSPLTVYVGQKAQFVPVVVGSGTLTYRWDKLVGGTFTQVQPSAAISVSASSPLLVISNITEGAAGTYRFTATDGNGSSTALASLAVTPALAISVKANGNAITNATLGVNSRARLVLEVTAAGDGPFSYQWRFNGANIVGATRERFEVASLLAANTGRYDVVVTGESARLTSDPLTVALVSPLKIVTQPVAKVAVNLGQSLDLSVAVNNPQGTTYQWIRGAGRASQMVSGGTSSTLHIEPVTASDAGSYSVIVTGAGGQGRLTSSASRVSVNLPASITVPPVAQLAIPGQSVTFSVVAAGTAPLSYQWLRDGVRIPGASSSSFQIASVGVNDAARYQVMVSNVVSTVGVTSTEAALTVSQPVTIVSEPQDTGELTAGERTPVAGVVPALLSVVAQGDGVLSYQWRRNGVNLVGETASVLRPSRLTVYSSGLYDVVIRNTVGAVEVSRVVSRKATVSVAVGGAGSGTLVETLTANEGDNVSFNSYAFSGQTTAWILEGGTLDTARTRGQGTSVLTLRSVTAADAGIYTAAVSGGSVSSIRWLLQVVPVPQITRQPVALVGSLAVPPKTDALLSAEVISSSDTWYQWYFQSSLTETSSAVPGANSNTLRIKSVTAADSGFYRLEVSNPAGTVSSNPTKIHVLQRVTVSAGIYTGATVAGGTLVSGSLGTGVIVGGTVNGGALETSVSVNPGSNATFGLVSTGDLVDSGNRAFQWYRLSASKVWTVMASAVSPTLTLTGLAEAQETFYRVRAFGAEGGAVDSAPVKLNVNDPVSFDKTLKTQEVSLADGSQATLSVVLNGYKPQYEWIVGGSVVASGISSSVSGGTLVTLPVVNGGTYSVRLRNDFTVPITRDVAVVTVKAGPTFLNTAAATPQAGSPATTAVTGVISADEGQVFILRTQLAQSAAPFTYQWRRNGVAITTSGRVSKGSFTTTPENVEFTFTNGVTAGDAGQYDVVVSNAWGSVISNPVNLLVALKPAIVTQPKAVTATKGGSANFTVEAIGAGTLSYQWLRSGTIVGSAKLLTVSNALLGGTYQVVVRSDRFAGITATSVSVPLTVTEPGDFTVSVGAALSGASVVSPVSALPGTALVLSATVSRSGTYSYQWRKDGIVLDNATASSFTLASVGNNSGGAYDVVVSDGANFAYSSAVTLVVDPRIELLEVPSSVNAGDGCKMQVKAVSSRTLSYQWYKGSVAISGATGDVFTVLSASTADAGTYSVGVSAVGGGVIRSESRSMSVAGRVTITAQPVPQSVVAGGTLRLSVSADNALTYQWYRTVLNGVRAPLVDGGGVSGATTRALTVSGVASGDAGVYQVEVGNSGGSALSVPVTVSVDASLAVSLATPPVAQVGGGVNLVASVVGTGSFTYQWYFTGGLAARRLILGETTDRLRINPVSISDAGDYTVEVGNGTATATASTTLSVLNVPEIVVAPLSQSVVAGGTVRFAVVAKFPSPLTYTWFRVTGGNRVQVLTGNHDTASQLTLSNVQDGSFATYTVRVAEAANASAAVEVSATLTQRSGPATVGVSVATDYTKWWVYWVEAVADIPANNRYGYWVSERLRDTTTGVVSAGRSVWVWAPNAQTGPFIPDAWTVEAAQTQEAADNTRSEFSVIANRTDGSALENYVIAGRVETGTEASVYAAPDTLAGEYEVGLLFEVDLSWDNEVTLAAGSAVTLEAVVDTLLGALTPVRAAPAGD
jgi:hypothetical protein